LTNGWVLARKMLFFCPNMKRLFMSGYAANVIVHHDVVDDEMHFIQKPFSRKELAAKVGDVLDKQLPTTYSPVQMVFLGFL
jgi:two-component system cell cycle sensor histidine kinase/response regulator CckA